MQGVLAVTEGLVELIELVQQGDAAGFVICKHLADHEGSIHGVLIPDIGTREVAIGFLKAEDEIRLSPLFFQAADHLADELEPGEDVNGFHPVMCGDFFRKVHRDDGFDEDGVQRHLAVLEALGTYKVEQKEANLVAREEAVTLRCGNSDSAAVTIRVGGKEEVRSRFFAEAEAELHGLADFRVGIGAGREGAVRLFLLGDDANVGEPGFAQGAGDGFEASAVQGRIHNGEIAVDFIPEKDGLTLYLFGKGGEDFLRDVADQTGGEGCVKISPLDIGKNVQRVDLGKDSGGRLGSDLATVRAIDLIAVVFGWVVRGRNHDAGTARENAYRIAETGCGHQLGIEVNAYAVCREDSRCCFAEDVALQAAVVADGDGRGRKLPDDIVGQALRGFGNGIDIHAVGARSQDAAEAAGAEGEVAVEGVLNLSGRHCGKGGLDFRLGGQLKPTIIFLLIGHRSE